MKILHICNDFCGSKVHRNLYIALSQNQIEQTIYTYFINPSFEEKNSFESKNTKIIYSNILHWYHRFFYQLKIEDVYKDLKKKIEVASFDIVHATTLFSDGALAYKLYKEYQIPYIVAIRSVDLHLFMKYMFHTWKLGKHILENASRIIFISKAGLEELQTSRMLKNLQSSLSRKCIVQPNGIDDFWLDNISTKRNISNNILFVGKFYRRKNILRLISAILELKTQIPNIQLNLVGSGGEDETKVLKLVKQYPETLHYYGEINDKNKLREIYLRNSIFAMPSLHETFGLTYVEALSQNLSVLYTKNEGFDGLLDIKVGEAVNPRSVKEISTALTNLLNERDKYIDNSDIEFKQFSWSFIASRYVRLYKEII